MGNQVTCELEQYHKDLLVIPLGGTGEIGMNVTLFHSHGKWVIVDLGVGFSDQELPGTDLTVPDVSFMVQNRKNLLGIVLTHAHEDHFGAIHYLWKVLGGPMIYGSPFTLAFFRAKLSAARLDYEIPMQEFNDEHPILNLGPFKIKMLRVTHSIPDAYCALIEAEGGKKVFHSGDWKLDDNPVITAPTDMVALEKIGDSGVDLMLCDSTNVFVPGKSGSEGGLPEHFRTIFSKSNKAIFATMFASNIARIHIIASVAKEFNRKVIVMGGALIRAVDAARLVGYLTDIDNLYPVEEMDRFKREELVIMCTGCQGEVLAAMSKIISGKCPGIEVCEGDAVIFSSVIIPGNELKVCRVMNQVILNGAHLYSMKNAHVHVSGHPAQDELKQLYQCIRPRVAIPVHGEAMHLYKHAELVNEWGSAGRTMIISNGDVVRVSDDVEVVGRVRHGKYAIDGRFFRSPDSEVMQVRRSLMAAGIVFVVVLLCAETGRILKKPTIIAPGLLDPKGDADMVKSMVSQIEHDLFNKTNLQPHVVRSVVFSILKRICQKRMNKYPEIRVHVERV